MAARSTICTWCQEPLTRRQITRRRRWCSRSCAKAQWHRQHPNAAKAAGQRGWELRRPQYVARLSAQVKACKTRGEAFRLGYVKGYTVGANARRRHAQRRPAA